MRKAQAGLDILGSSALQIGVTVLIISMVALLLANIQTSPSITAGSVAALTISNGTSGMGTFGTYIPIIVLVIVFVVLLTLIVGVYAAFRGKSQ